MVNKTKPNTPYQPQSINATFMETGEIDPKDINTNLSVQRSLEPARLRIIQKSMSLMGYDYSNPVTISQDMTGVDGMHRIHLAIVNGYKKIPYVKYNFATKNDMYRYFQLCQTQTPSMNARDELFAYLQTQHPYAVLVYSLCKDKSCMFYACHDLKLKQGDKKAASNIKIENICYIVNGIIFNKKTGWSRSHANALATWAMSVISNRKEMILSISKINDFMTFFFNAFGWDTSKKEGKFKEVFLHASMELFVEYLLPHSYFSSDRKIVEAKLSKLVINKEFTSNHKLAIIGMFLKCINSNRQNPKRIYGIS